MAQPGTTIGTLEVACPGCGQDVEVTLGVRSVMAVDGHLSIDCEPQFEHQCPRQERPKLVAV